MLSFLCFNSSYDSWRTLARQIHPQLFKGFRTQFATNRNLPMRVAFPVCNPVFFFSCLAVVWLSFPQTVFQKFAKSIKTCQICLFCCGWQWKAYNVSLRILLWCIIQSFSLQTPFYETHVMQLLLHPYTLPYWVISPLLYQKVRSQPRGYMI